MKDITMQQCEQLKRLAIFDVSKGLTEDVNPNQVRHKYAELCYRIENGSCDIPWLADTLLRAHRPAMVSKSKAILKNEQKQLVHVIFSAIRRLFKIWYLRIFL